MINSLLKAAVGVAVDLPVSTLKDVATLGGSLTDDESAVAKSLGTIGDNLEKAVDPKTPFTE